jgi:hypothetical protein
LEAGFFHAVLDFGDLDGEPHAFVGAGTGSYAPPCGKNEKGAKNEGGCSVHKEWFIA